MSAEPPIVIADEPQKRNVTEYFIIAPKIRTLNLVQDARDQNRHYDLFGYAIHCLSISLFSFKHTYVCGRCIIHCITHPVTGWVVLLCKIFICT